jgi:hypothetical protein
MSDWNLRKPSPPPAQPPKSAARVVPGLKGSVPFQPGDALHESETRDLVPFGWKPGDPIPPQFAAELTVARKAILEDVKSGKLDNVNVPPLKAPHEVPVEALPPEKQAELRELLSQYKDMAPQLQALQSRGAPVAGGPQMDPSLREIIQGSGIEIVDSRAEAQPIGKPVDPGTVPVASTEPAPQPGEDHRQCPNCLFELSRKVEEPDLADKAAFAIAAFGGQRFLKVYKFMGDRVFASFRALTSSQSTMLATQLGHDQMVGRVSNIDDFFRLAFNYRLVLSLVELTLPDKNLPVGKAVEDILSDPETTLPGEPTPLPGIVQILQTKSPFDNESTWRILVGAARKFHELVQMLESRADKPDFWNAIEV